jgi:hypothetical protein
VLSWSVVKWSSNEEQSECCPGQWLNGVQMKSSPGAVLVSG